MVCVDSSRWSYSGGSPADCHSSSALWWCRWAPPWCTRRTAGSAWDAAVASWWKPLSGSPPGPWYLDEKGESWMSGIIILSLCTSLHVLFLLIRPVSVSFHRLPRLVPDADGVSVPRRSVSRLPGLRVFTATAVVPFHTPSKTSPNCPAPSFSSSLMELRSISHWSTVL